MSTFKYALFYTETVSFFNSNDDYAWISVERFLGNADIWKCNIDDAIEKYAEVNGLDVCNITYREIPA